MMLKQITTEAQKLMVKVRKGKMNKGQELNTQVPVPYINTQAPYIKTNFPCIYCSSENLNEYHAYRKIVGLNPYSNTWQPVPHLENWTEFKLHMLCEHPDQWGRSEEDIVGVQHPRTWNNPQGLAERKRVKNIYLNIRAWPEYGWNFFLHIHGDPLWTGKSLQPTLLGLPEDETSITGIKWIPRKNPETNELWNVNGTTSWLCEKESRTHTRAQNAVGPQLNRGINAVRRILRGAKHAKTNLQDGCVLVRSMRDTNEVGDVPFKKLYAASCLLHKRALTALASIRMGFQLNGAGNSGQLQALELWKKEGEPYRIAPNGVIEHDYKGKQINIEVSELETKTSEAPKEMIAEIVTPDDVETVSTTTDETVQQTESTATIDLNNLVDQLTRVIPPTEYYLSILNDVQSVFTYTRKLQDNMNNEDMERLQERITDLAKERNDTKADNQKIKQELETAHNALRDAKAARDVAESNLKAYINQQNDLTTKIAQLQKQLNTRLTPRQQIAAVGQNTVNQLSKPKNVTVV